MSESLATSGVPAAPSALQQSVTAAFALGWQMAELYHARFAHQQPDDSVPERLPGKSRLRSDQQVELALDRIKARLARFATPLEEATLAGLDTADLDALFTSATSTPADGHKAVYQLHVRILQKLTAVDFRFGIAYSLGRSLADSCLRCDTPADITREFGPHRLNNLRGWLNDLATALPPHSAKAVLQALTSWEAWVANFTHSQHDPPTPADISAIRKTLHRQGELWRSLLTGETAALDLLTTDDYLQAARLLVQRALGLARTTLRQLGLLPLFALALLGVLALLVFLFSESAAQILAAVGALAAAFGITWKSVTSALAKAAEAVEVPLWNAELDGAIAVAATYLPALHQPPPDMRLLDCTPLYLRALHHASQGSAAEGATAEDLQQIVGAPRLSRSRRGLSREDARALRRRTPSPAEIHYWLTWAQVAGYVEPLAPDSFSLTAEGQRLARIPPGHTGATRAALFAARPGSAPGDPASGG